jgi:FixJ family two-component response regulator
VIEAFEKKNQPIQELNTLTNKEKQILELLAKGFLYKEIGDHTSSYPQYGETTYSPHLRKAACTKPN